MRHNSNSINPNHFNLTVAKHTQLRKIIHRKLKLQKLKLSKMTLKITDTFETLTHTLSNISDVKKYPI